MRLLVLDAALGPCSVALLEDGHCLDLRHGAESRAATASLPVLVQDMLARHGPHFDAVAVTIGPGGFTGLRGSLALANGLALGARKPVVGVTVAEAFLAAADDPAAWVAIDSRRAGRVFLCRDGGVEAVSLDSLLIPDRPVTVLGDAARPVAEALRRAGADATVSGDGAVSAAAVGRVALRRLAGELPPCAAQPLYVEPPEARAAASSRPAPT